MVSMTVMGNGETGSLGAVNRSAGGGGGRGDTPPAQGP
jgi:hypothetical protein